MGDDYRIFAYQLFTCAREVLEVAIGSATERVYPLVRVELEPT